MRNFDPYSRLISRITSWVAPIASGAFMLSFLLPEWRNYSVFEQAVLELIPDSTSNDAFYALRENAITMAFSLRDHSAAAGLIAYSWIGSQRFWPLLCRMLGQRILLAFMPAIIGLSIAAGCISSLTVDYNRYSYPSWADTMTIPTVGIVIASIGFLMLALLHLPILWAKSLRVATGFGRILSAYLSAAMVMIGVAILVATISGTWFLLPACLLSFFFFTGFGII